ncbi:endonuclease III protein [Rutstroemia sp. NJR-2017a BVV2]|nr:endonuclease III protein [Rutstroemia sp. NJR-2017a BVV2]
MRTSRISQDTAKILNATSLPKNTRTTRSALARFAHNAVVKNEDEDASHAPDIEDVIPSTRKRKRSNAPRIPVKKESLSETTIKKEIEETVTFSAPTTKPSRVRKPARKVKNEETGEVEIHAPNDWKEVYDLVMQMRKSGVAQNAAVDTMGCDKLGQDTVDPKTKRYHTLTALMLSSQTKDTTNAVAMNRLYNELPAYKEGAPTGLNLDNILAVDPKLLNELIWVVGFHNNKTKYIKAAAEILRDQWNGDIPDTIEGLMSLPGVGPKMAYLCLSSAWGRTEGIGVDVHVHRITNLWGWQNTKTPEETRLALQSWLPKELWHEINWLLVGFGQTVCLPIGRKCGDCELGIQGLCKAADRSKVTIGRKIKEEKIKQDEEGNVVDAKTTMKTEEDSRDIPINEDEKAAIMGEDIPHPSTPDLAGAEEKKALEEIANAPGELEKTPKRKRR